MVALLKSGMNFYRTLCDGCNYWYMVVLRLIHVSKMSHWCRFNYSTKAQITLKNHNYFIDQNLKPIHTNQINFISKWIKAIISLINFDFPSNKTNIHFKEKLQNTYSKVHD